MLHEELREHARWIQRQAMTLRASSDPSVLFVAERMMRQVEQITVMADRCDGKVLIKPLHRPYWGNACEGAPDSFFASLPAPSKVSSGSGLTVADANEDFQRKLDADWNHI